MTRLAGMQPYFFPYIGYWKLIYAADVFVLFDEAQYMRQGWVNRNRILMNDGTWRYILAPVRKHSVDTPIKDVFLVSDHSWRKKIFNQLIAAYKTKAPYFDETFLLVESLLKDIKDTTIAGLNCRLIKEICRTLGIDTEIIISSEFSFDYSCVRESDDWPLAHALQLGATEVINPVGGLSFFCKEKFKLHGIDLLAMPVVDIAYGQPNRYVQSSMSIIDVLMYNGAIGARKFLDL